jgi:hypothetical protein
MKQLLKTTVASAAAVFALGFVAMSTPAAAAGNTGSSNIDYCRTDITSGMRGCGYTSLEQCHAMSSGRGGDCYPNPFPSSSASSGGSSNGNSYAYQPKHPHSKSARKPVEDR